MLPLLICCALAGSTAAADTVVAHNDGLRVLATYLAGKKVAAE